MYHTGWRRRIKFLKLQVISRKRATNYRALSRKMTNEDKALYDSTPPCIVIRIYENIHLNVSHCLVYYYRREIPLYLYRVAKTHMMPYLYRSFSGKQPYN